MVRTTQPGRFSILIADDDADYRETLREIVAPEGFQTILAEDGEQALDIVQHHNIHLLVCDMHMPRLSGLETLQLVRQFNALMPCILISGDVNERLIRQALAAKAYSVIAKPVSKNVFIYTVVRAIHKVYEHDQERDHPWDLEGRSPF
jgi:CheY-like chemotaxis protein